MANTNQENQRQERGGNNQRQDEQRQAKGGDNQRQEGQREEQRQEGGQGGRGDKRS